MINIHITILECKINQFFALSKTKRSSINIEKLYQDLETKEQQQKFKQQKLDNEHFFKMAYGGLTEQEQFEAIIEDKVATSQILTSKEIAFVNDNYFLPKGFKCTNTYGLAKLKK